MDYPLLPSDMYSTLTPAASTEQLYLAMWNKDQDKKWKELSDRLGDSGRGLINASNLDLTLVNPTVADTGLYKCKTKFNVTRVNDKDDKDDDKDIGPVRRRDFCLMNTGPGRGV